MRRRITYLWLGLFIAFNGSLVVSASATPNVVIWDAQSLLAGGLNPARSAIWRPVPAEIFGQEKDPLKAASDPGYYGREYSFSGDAVVENQNLAAVFESQNGTVTLFAKDGAGSTPGAGGFGRRMVNLVPLQLKSLSPVISEIVVVRNTGDEAALEVSFSVKGSAPVSALFAFDRTGIVEVRPGESMKGFSLRSPIEYAIAPDFIGDDLIYAAKDYARATSVSVPAANVLVGLLKGEDAELVMTWPTGQQQVNLALRAGSTEGQLIESIDFENAGQSFYLAALRAPGIWHRESLTAAYLEQDVTSEWKPPFPAKWMTQLVESRVRTSFKFRDEKGEIWRGVPGSYIYPVWFEGADARFHLSKKIPPKGEALIYCLEGSNTPPDVSTPTDILKATLGRPACEAILDFAGRKLRTHHRRTDALTHRACTCGYTEAIQVFFEKKQEVEKKADVASSLDDMVFFVQAHVDRIGEYRRFADEMTVYLRAQSAANAKLAPYLAGLEQTIQQIPQEYEVQKENMKSMPYTEELVQRTMALTGKQEDGNLDAYMELLKDWRAMGGAQDYVVARCHMIVRQLAQEAGYGCAEQAGAVAIAAEIRSRCKQVLRNPDGYEIWSDY
jgi:hypothetical protein